MENERQKKARIDFARKGYEHAAWCLAKGLISREEWPFKTAKWAAPEDVGDYMDGWRECSRWRGGGIAPEDVRGEWEDLVASSRE